MGASVGGSVTTGGASVAVAGAPPQAVSTLAITRSDNKTNRLRFTFLLLREILFWIQLRANAGKSECICDEAPPSEVSEQIIQQKEI
jgi:hypothetical protein